MGITFTRLFNRLFSKKEIRILMVRAPLAVDATAFFFRRRAPSSQIHRLIAKPRAFSISAGWSDAAGKTTILYKLKLGEIVTTIPTIGTCRRRASLPRAATRAPDLEFALRRVPSVGGEAAG